MPSYIRGEDSFDSKNINVGVAKAFVYYDSLPATPVIFDSFNVIGLTDLGPGDIQVNLDTPMPDANYACFASADLLARNAVAIAVDQSTIGVKRFLTSTNVVEDGLTNVSVLNNP